MIVAMIVDVTIKVDVRAAADENVVAMDGY